VWGRAASELCAELLAARTLAEVVSHLSRAITARTENDQRFEPSSARLARRAVGLLEAGEPRVDGVAERLGVTARHLRRAFREHIGIGPKEFARTVRLQRAVRMAESSTSGHARHDWVRIAADAGYYDQAHLIADFRELIGLTPGAFQRRTRDAEALAPAAE
jgi:transcriptional regulator GlxA family with amidase domain